jgi:hypothetical protein
MAGGATTCAGEGGGTVAITTLCSVGAVTNFAGGGGGKGGVKGTANSSVGSVSAGVVSSTASAGSWGAILFVLSSASINEGFNCCASGGNPDGRVSGNTCAGTPLVTCRYT